MRNVLVIDTKWRRVYDITTQLKEIMILEHVI